MSNLTYVRARKQTVVQQIRATLKEKKKEKENKVLKF